MRREALNKLVILGERHLRHVVAQFVDHYHRERHHQSLRGQLIAPLPEDTAGTGDVQCRERLGGILKFYYRAVS
jgi:hypothetical protein